MRRIFLAVLLVAIFSISGFAQAKVEESFSVKKGSIAIITVGGVQIAIFNDSHCECGTFYIIDPKTQEVIGMRGISDSSKLFIDEGEISIHCIFSAVGSKRNPKLESRPLIVKR